jgi:hypothetical protein
VLAIALILVAAAILAYRIFSATGSQRLDQSNFYDAVTERRVRTITMVPDGIGLEIRGTLNSEATYPDDRSVERFTTYVLADPNLPETLSDNGVSVKAEIFRANGVTRKKLRPGVRVAIERKLWFDPLASRQLPKKSSSWTSRVARRRGFFRPLF